MALQSFDLGDRIGAAKQNLTEVREQRAFTWEQIAVLMDQQSEAELAAWARSHKEETPTPVAKRTTKASTPTETR